MVLYVCVPVNLYVYMSMFMYTHLHGGYVCLATDSSIMRMNRYGAVQKACSCIHALNRPGYARLPLAL